MPGFTACGLGSAGRRTPGLVSKNAGGAALMLIALFVPGATNSGSGSFVASAPGFYKVYAVGGGGGSSSYGTNGGGSGSGAIVRRRVFLFAGQSLSIVVGKAGIPPGGNNGSTGFASTVTFPDGSSMTAGGGSSGASTTPGAGGTPSGSYDVGLAGTIGSQGSPGPPVFPPALPGFSLVAGWGGGANADTSGSGAVWILQG